jgi:tol-pal system protein YbgF
LEQDLREFTNRAEEQGNLLNQINRGIEDLAVRMRAIEQGAAQRPVPAPISPLSTLNPVPPPTTGRGPNDPASSTSTTVEPLGVMTTNGTTGEAVVPPGDPTFLYENALELLKQRDYILAEKSLTDFLKSYPNHQLAANAKYWLGETYFVQDRFDQASRVFAEGYQKYPKGPKAADNLLKLGLSLAAQNNTDDACVALKQIAKDFPTGAGAVKSRASSEMKKLKCS